MNQPISSLSGPLILQTQPSNIFLLYCSKPFKILSVACVTFCPVGSREYWIICRVPGFLTVGWFGSSPTQIETTFWWVGGGWWGRSQIIRQRESPFYSTLCVLGYSPRVVFLHSSYGPFFSSRSVHLTYMNPCLLQKFSTNTLIPKFVQPSLVLDHIQFSNR
jgi:hypothetical protein